MSERITVVGAGVVGTNLARALSGAGHAVRLGARDVSSEKVSAAVDRLGLDVVPLGEAATGTDVVVLAVPYEAVESSAAAIRSGSDVIVVDASNRLATELPPGAGSVLDVIASTGLTSPLVKAFNTIGAEAFVDPVVDGKPLFLPVAGDVAGVERVVEIARSIGFDAVGIGDRDAARLNENFAELWIHLAFRVGFGRDFGFARLDR